MGSPTRSANRTTARSIVRIGRFCPRSFPAALAILMSCAPALAKTHQDRAEEAEAAGAKATKGVKPQRVGSWIPRTGLVITRPDAIPRLLGAWGPRNAAAAQLPTSRPTEPNSRPTHYECVRSLTVPPARDTFRAGCSISCRRGGRSPRAVPGDGTTRCGVRRVCCNRPGGRHGTLASPYI